MPNTAEVVQRMLVSLNTCIPNLVLAGSSQASSRTQFAQSIVPHIAKEWRRLNLERQNADFLQSSAQEIDFDLVHIPWTMLAAIDGAVCEQIKYVVLESDNDENLVWYGLIHRDYNYVKPGLDKQLAINLLEKIYLEKLQNPPENLIDVLYIVGIVYAACNLDLSFTELRNYFINSDNFMLTIAAAYLTSKDSAIKQDCLVLVNSFNMHAAMQQTLEMLTAERDFTPPPHPNTARRNP